MSGPETYKFESPMLARECYQLLTILHASRGMHERVVELSKDYDPVYFGPTPGTLSSHLLMEESEANRIILNLAIVVRNSIESDPMLPGEDDDCGYVLTAKEFPLNTPPPDPFPETPRGFLHWFKREGLKEEALNIRETCNKLIHAKGIDWERKPVKGANEARKWQAGKYLTGNLLLYGNRNRNRQNEQHWVAVIDTERFALSSSILY